MMGNKTSNIIIKIISLVFLVCWMIVVFIFSSEVGNESSVTSGNTIRAIFTFFCNDIEYTKLEQIIDIFQPLVRKIAHLTLYTIGGFFIYNFLYRFKLNKNKKITLSFLIGAIYAITDEIHQFFVPGRSSSMLDVFIDSVGIIIGIILLLCCQDILNFRIIWKLLIPIILVIAGLCFIFKDTVGGKINKEIKKLNANKKGSIEYAATFSGQNINFDKQPFNGADLNAVFGGIKCDLRNSIINSDQVINASSIFGGIDIFVPASVQVKIKSTPIFGGVSDKSTHTANAEAPTIYINATCIFGGVDIK